MREAVNVRINKKRKTWLYLLSLVRREHYRVRCTLRPTFPWKGAHICAYFVVLSLFGFALSHFTDMGHGHTRKMEKERGSHSFAENESSQICVRVVALLIN